MAHRLDFHTARRRLGLISAAAALSIASGPARASDAPPTQTVTVTGARAAPMAGLAGFGDQPAWRVPFSLAALPQSAIQDLGLTTPAGLVRWDASTSDAYNAPGYWSQFTLRGYLLDPRSNLRRDGLPINGETAALALDHLQAIRILKGASGIQAGTSTPGGLVDLVVKRPIHQVHDLRVGLDSNGGHSFAADLGRRQGSFGWRLNAAAEAMRPEQDRADGRRHLLALALEADAGALGRIEFEVEHARQSQPSVPGFSLLGGQVPDPRRIAERRNLNDQPWSLPVDSVADTLSLRLSRRLGPGLTAQLHALHQRLRTDDRIAFPFGCSAEGQFDRYCSDGSFDLYDFRSENERRRQSVLDLHLRGSGQRWEATAGALFQRASLRTQPQAFNYVGTGAIDPTPPVVPDPSAVLPNTLRDEHSAELYLRGRWQIDDSTDAWAGLRATRLGRASRQTDGSQPIDYRQHMTTPWLALTRRLGSATVYASWGQGAESAAVPNLPGVFTNAGELLPVQRSRQFELGAKWRVGAGELSAAAFDIRRPATSDLIGRRQLDGVARHRGVELGWDGQAGPWSWHAGTMLLEARRQGSADATRNGLRPTNVPARTLRLFAAHDLAALPGLQLHVLLTAEGPRMVLPDNQARLGGWARADAGARYAHRTPAGQLTWRLGLDNLANRRAWKESPYQFGHAYLFPLPARTLRLSAQLGL